MERTQLNRHTTNPLAWTTALKEIADKYNDELLIPMTATCLIRAKDILKENVMTESGLNKYTFPNEITMLNDTDFGKLCLYFANISIYNTGVFEEDNKLIYSAEVNNTVPLWPLLLSDFLINVRALRELYPERETEISIKLASGDANGDPFLFMMKKLFERYIPEVKIFAEGKQL